MVGALKLIKMIIFQPNFQLDQIPYVSVPQHAIIRAVWSNGRYHIEYVRMPVDETS